MKRAVIVLAAGLALLALSAWLFRGGDPAAQARAAYESGDYAAAVRQYQQAAPECTDLGALAANQAAALYRLDRYSEADGRYLFAESGGDASRAARAAYDRGNCALRQACCAEGTPDPALLDRAAEQFRACLDRESSVSGAGALFADARHNLELTRLLRNPDAAPDSAAASPSEQKDSATANRGQDGGDELAQDGATSQPASPDGNTDPANNSEATTQASTSDGNPENQNESPSLASLGNQEEEDDECPS